MTWSSSVKRRTNAVILRTALLLLFLGSLVLTPQPASAAPFPWSWKKALSSRSLPGNSWEDCPARRICAMRLFRVK